MRKTLSVIVVSSIVLAGCGTVRDSRLNPFNWFGRSEPAQVTPVKAEEANPLIPKQSRLKRKKVVVYSGTVVSAVKSLEIDRTKGGAIIRVTGVPSQQGAHSVVLEAMNEGKPVDGVLTYRLLAIQPTSGGYGSEQSRQVQAAVFLTDNQLVGVRTIKVEAASNALASRR